MHRARTEQRVSQFVDIRTTKRVRGDITCGNATLHAPMLIETVAHARDVLSAALYSAQCDTSGYAVTDIATDTGHKLYEVAHEETIKAPAVGLGSELLTRGRANQVGRDAQPAARFASSAFAESHLHFGGIKARVRRCHALKINAPRRRASHSVG
jgi:hypothetical protein